MFLFKFSHTEGLATDLLLGITVLPTQFQ